ncbi:Na+/H+ antiporter subunit D [Falsarthrobacter nasiphocae]|uniref:Na+/H+ antiporter subunit D n=1 Tax=Falsarthrobacter nasiphocae TaxID=189863 RepID=UPI00361CCFD0
MDTTAAAPFAIGLPFLGAAAAFLVARHPGIQRIIAIVSLTLTLILESSLLISTILHGPTAVYLGGWAPPFGISMVVDAFASFMLVVSTLVSLAVLVFATGQDAEESEQDGPVSIFHPTYLILVGGVSNAFLAGDLFNLYVGFEILLTASYVLMTLGATDARIRAALTYVVVSVVSSVLFLLAIGLVYAATGTVNMADVAMKLSALPHGTQMALHALLLVAFCIKAAVFPLSFWLPDSYPTAPAPVTAVFAGLLTKVGVYAIIRTETLLFPGDDFNTILMVAGAVTMIVGILGALAQFDLKRLLSFTLVSHIGYLIFGIGTGSIVGLGASVYYVAHHIIVQTSLFLVAGLIERVRGVTNIERLGGLAKSLPFVSLLFFIPAMNLAGIPPMSGFLGKVGLIQAGIMLDTPVAWIAVAASIVTSLLTLMAIARVWNRAFWREQGESTAAEAEVGREDDQSGQPLTRSMVAATLSLVLAGLALTVVAGPLYRMSGATANELIERTPYIEAVMGEERLSEVPATHGGTAPSPAPKGGQ